MSENDPEANATEESEAEPVFANRAERRAKGRAGSQRQVFSKGQAPTGRGAVQSPRQYGNRRSG